MNNVAIRRATAADMDGVYEMLCLLSQKEHHRLRFEKCYWKNLADEQIVYLVAEVDGILAGFISCHSQQLLHHTGTAYEIQEMFIKETFRGLGIGKEMIAMLRSLINETEFDVFEVTSSNWREEAHAFYLNNGFVQTHKKFTSSGNYSSR